MIVACSSFLSCRLQIKCEKGGQCVKSTLNMVDLAGTENAVCLVYVCVCLYVYVIVYCLLMFSFYICVCFYHWSHGTCMYSFASSPFRVEILPLVVQSRMISLCQSLCVPHAPFVVGYSGQSNERNVQH